MAQVDPSLRKAWRASPRKKVDLILHVDGNVQERAHLLETQGVEVRRTFRLTRTLSVRCTASRALKLLDLPWVTRVETDSTVHALKRGAA